LDNDAVFNGFFGWNFFACFSPWLQVANVEVAGAQKINSDDFVKKIQDTAQKQLAFFPTKSILLFNINAAREELLKEFPQLADIKIERQFPSTIYAAIVERSPSAAIKNEKGDYYIVDDNGIFLKLYPKPTTIIYLKLTIIRLLICVWGSQLSAKIFCKKFYALKIA